MSLPYTLPSLGYSDVCLCIHCLHENGKPCTTTTATQCMAVSIAFISIVASGEPLSCWCTLYSHVSNVPSQIYKDGTAFCSWRRQVCQFMCAWIQVLDSLCMGLQCVGALQNLNINWNKSVQMWMLGILFATWGHSNKHRPYLELATRIATTYGCGLPYCSVFYKKVTQSQHIFTTVTRSPAITSSF